MPVENRYPIANTGWTAPADKGGVVAKSDTVDLPYVTKGIRVGTGGGGTLTVVYPDDTTHLISNVQDGERFDVRIKRVNSTGTTVSNIDWWA